MAYAEANMSTDLKATDELLYQNLGIEAEGGLPAVGITWYDAAKWCNAFSTMMGLTPVYYRDSGSFETVYLQGEVELTADHVRWTADGFRLPTVPEWEYAARFTGVGSALSPETEFSGYTDGTQVTDYAWIEDNAVGVPHRVALKTSTAAGLYDMSGNVAEWCWIEAEGTITFDGVYNPRSLGTARPAAGGSFRDSASNAATNVISYDARNPQYPYPFIGLRVVRYQSP